MNPPARISYIDNLRIFLIALVVLHHLAITYGAAGSWYYKEVEGDTFTTLILTMFTASNQSFFMGLFFLISAYFTKISISRKSLGFWARDRLTRLGIPLLVYYFLLSPLTIYMKFILVKGEDLSFIDFLRHYQGFGFGPMWFVETLIYFSLIYIVYKLIFREKTGKPSIKPAFPGPLMIILFSFGIAVVSFMVRLRFPLGSEIGNTGLQLPFFPQYIAMLWLGLLFAKYDWFEEISFRLGIRWFIFSQLMILVAFPLIFYFGAKDSGLEPFTGGWTWQAATLVLWEQFTGTSMMIGLIGIFKQKFNSQGRWAKHFSGAAYAVFIIHPFVIVTLSSLLKDWTLYPVLKFTLLAPLALFLCFGFGIILKLIPGVNKVV